MGSGIGPGAGAPPPVPSETTPPAGQADELRMLREQAEQLGSQMQQILQRIRHLEEQQ
jgi:hypothetical protein